MILTKFYLRNPNGSSETPIYLFVTLNTQRRKFPTGMKVLPSLWDVDNGKLREDSRTRITYNRNHPGGDAHLRAVQKRLDDLKGALNRYELECMVDERIIDFDGIKRCVEAITRPQSIDNQSNNSVLGYLKSMIEDAEKGNRLNRGKRFTEGTIKNYRNLQQAVERFEQDRRCKLRWDSFDSIVYADFLRWHEENGLSKNYLGKHMKDLKAIMRQAFDEDVHQSIVFRAKWFAVPQERVTRETLTLEEINLLAKLTLKPGSASDRARDVFLIGCYSGLRVSDIWRLAPDTIMRDAAGRPRISMTMKKTGKLVEIPVNSDLDRILRKYGDQPPCIKEQTVNRLLKKIAIMAGIPERKASGLTIHVSRHSFATHLYHHERLPISDVMTLTGHTTEANFRRYINAKTADVAERLEQHQFFK